MLDYTGVKVTIARAFALEDIPVAELFGDLGSPEMLEKHRERVAAIMERLYVERREGPSSLLEYTKTGKPR